MSVKPLEKSTSSAADESVWYVVGAYVSFAAAILLVLVVAGWGIYLDFEESRKNLLRTEINRLRSHAMRTVIRIQGNYRDASGRSLEEVLDELRRPDSWLRVHWRQFLFPDESRLNAVLVDSTGRVVIHSRPENEGRLLPTEQGRVPVPEMGEDVYEISDVILTGDVPGYDITLPIEFDNREFGVYHSVFNRSWFDNKLNELRAASLQRWVIAFAVIAGVITLAGFTLYHFSRRISRLRSALALGHTQRMAELGQLAGSLAHEVRNPLNTIRLNLHVVQRMFDAQSGHDSRTDALFRETIGEMERVDGLLSTLLNYARPDAPVVDAVDLAEELRSVCNFLQPTLERDEMTCVTSPISDGLIAAIDRTRFRQILLNLVRNSMEAAGSGGTIEISLRRGDDAAVLTIRDSGPGVPPESAERIFDPFFTTKEVGTGLGLTLVKRYVQEVGGSIELKSTPPAGATFVLRFPLLSSVSSSDATSAGIVVNHVA